MTIGNPAFCLLLYLTGVHLRSELQDGADVSQQKIKCRPIRTREIGGVTLSDVQYDIVKIKQESDSLCDFVTIEEAKEYTSTLQF